MQVNLAHPCVFPIALRAVLALFPLFGVPDGFIIKGAQLDPIGDRTLGGLR